MPKRRRLSDNQDVIIIYEVDVGYVKKHATFKYYKSILYNNVTHDIPVFNCNGQEITGDKCFWVLESEVSSDVEIEKIRKELISAQMKTIEFGIKENYTVPEKIKDPQLKKEAVENSQRMKALIQKFGFDPRDETWIETHMAASQTESDWFQFEREYTDAYTRQSWQDIADVFNKEYNAHITAEHARALAKKRMRYLLGAMNTRLSGNANVEDWKKSASEFEKFHKEVDERMETWSRKHRDAYPIVKVKKSLPFYVGPFFNECIERIPQLFTTPRCEFIEKGVTLRVITYDPKDKFIRLDFMPDIRRLIISGIEREAEPWIKSFADYDFLIDADKIEEYLTIIDKLE